MIYFKLKHNKFNVRLPIINHSFIHYIIKVKLIRKKLNFNFLLLLFPLIRKLYTGFYKSWTLLHVSKFKLELPNFISTGSKRILTNKLKVLPSSMLFKNSQNSLLFILTSEKPHLYLWTYSLQKVFSPLKCKEIFFYQLAFLNY